MTDPVTFTMVDGVTVATLRGPRTCYEVEERIAAAFDARLADPAVRLVAVDVRGLDGATANLGGKLVILHKRLSLRGGRLGVCVAWAFAEYLKVTRMDKMFSVHADLDAVLAAVQPLSPQFLETAWLDGVLVVRVTRGWGVAGEDVLKRELQETLAHTTGPPDTVLDLRDLKDGDVGSAFLGGLHPLVRGAAERGGELRLTSLTPAMHGVIDMVNQPAPRYVIAPSVAAAVAELAARRRAAEAPA